MGGGVAGLKAAVTAALRGHRVVLCEKSDKVGGILKCEQAIDFKQEMYQLGLSLEAQAKEAGVEIRCNTEVTPEYAEKENADVMILAVGSNPIVPPLKRYRRGQCGHRQQLLSGKRKSRGFRGRSRRRSGRL